MPTYSFALVVSDCWVQEINDDMSIKYSIGQNCWCFDITKITVIISKKCAHGLLCDVYGYFVYYLAICIYTKGSSTSNLLLVIIPEVSISDWRNLLLGDKVSTKRRWYRSKEEKVKKKKATKSEMTFQSKFSPRHLSTYKSKLKESVLKKKKKKSLLYLFGAMFTFGLGESRSFTCSFYL